MKKTVSIIIPFLNEAENISFLVERLNTAFIDTDFLVEILFVNDGSSDQSLSLLKDESHKSYSCKIISLSKNFGSHAALRAGILYAIGDYITFMYADLQDPISLVDDLRKKCDGGFEIAWACRESVETNFSEKMFSKTYAYLMKKYAISSYPERGFDIVMFSKKVQKLVNDNIEANSSIFLQILTLGFNQTSIFYKKEARLKGKSKWTISKKIKLFVDSFVSFSYVPIRLVTLTGFLLFFAGFGWVSYIIFRKLMYNDLATGWTTLVSTLMLGFGITNISLGIIAEYLWRTLDSTRRRPVFIIDEITEIPKK